MALRVRRRRRRVCTGCAASRLRTTPPFPSRRAREASRPTLVGSAAGEEPRTARRPRVQTESTSSRVVRVVVVLVVSVTMTVRVVWRGIIPRVAPLAPLREASSASPRTCRVQRHARVVDAILSKGHASTGTPPRSPSHPVQAPRLSLSAPLSSRDGPGPPSQTDEGVQGAQTPTRADEVRAGVGVSPRRSVRGRRGRRIRPSRSLCRHRQLGG